MTTVNLEYAQHHLAELLDKASNGESFIIEREGKPRVQVTIVPEPAPAPQRRTGFMKGQIQVPEDFDTMHQDEIIDLFEIGEKPERRIGFLDGQFMIPDDIKALDSEEIVALFKSRS